MMMMMMKHYCYTTKLSLLIVSLALILLFVRGSNSTSSASASSSQIAEANNSSGEKMSSSSASSSGLASPKAADRVKDEQESVWVEFIQLALEVKPLNLGQGFPDFAAPKYLLDSLHEATNISDPKAHPNSQYTRSFGHPRLVRALVDYYREFRAFGRLNEPNEQVLVTVGAYEALFASIMAFVNPGDEVIIIEPAFDAYAPIVSMAQGRSVFVPLRRPPEASNSSSGSSRSSTVPLSSGDFAIDMREFESKISNRTRLLVLNSPNNPLGKMYTLGELERLAELCKRHNILVLADEVYEQMHYESREHLSMAKLPGMWERTITVGSAGKTFSVTGWKIGWALGPKELIKYVQLIHQTAIYTVATPLQEAIARALEHEVSLLKQGKRTYWDELRAELAAKRDRMAAILERAKMRPVVPEGGYFMLADFSHLAALNPEYAKLGFEPDGNRVNSNDYRFVRWLSRYKKLQGIPAGAFYSSANKRLADSLVRFCFIKQEATLDAMERILANLQPDAATAARLKPKPKL